MARQADAPARAAPDGGAVDRHPGGAVVPEDDPGEGDRQPDDVSPPAKTRLIRGLEAAVDSAIPEESRADLRGQLREADEALAQARAQNAAALREANRQQRIAPENMPNLVLVVAVGQGKVKQPNGKPGREAGNAERLAREGVQFTHFRAAPADEASVPCSLLTGLKVREETSVSPQDSATAAVRRRQVTCSEVLWNGGYTTALIGECSLDGAIAATDPRRCGFDEWIGYRSASEAKNTYPEQLWNNGARIGIAENAGGKQVHRGTDLLLQETLAYLDRHRRGRPFFLCVAWPMPGGESAIGELDRWDRAIGAVADRLGKSGHRGKSILLVMGPTDVPARLWVWGPGRISRGVVDKDPCGPCDILPTLEDLGGVSRSRRPKVSDGRSLAGRIAH